MTLPKFDAYKFASKFAHKIHGRIAIVEDISRGADIAQLVQAAYDLGLRAMNRAAANIDYEDPNTNGYGCCMRNQDWYADEIRALLPSEEDKCSEKETL